MHDFQYLQPTTVADASAMLADHGEDSRVIAGGTALLLALRQRMIVPSTLISVSSLEDMRGISYRADKGLRIGGLTTHNEIATHPDIRANYPMLADMAGHLANPQVRNQGTLGGNLCYGDPQTDPPSALLALGAQVMLGSARGSRFLSIEEFLVDFYTTALEPDEVLIRIYVPVQKLNVGKHVRFRKTAAEHRPLVNVAVAGYHASGVCEDPRIVVGASTPVPRRIARAEAALAGKAITRDLIAEVAEVIAQDANLISDMRGDEDYRRDVVRAVSRRTLGEVFGVQVNG